MPFIEPQDRTQNVELRVKVRPEVLGMLDDYATFLNSEPWYIVQEVLRKSIDGDRDFRKWKEQQAAAPIDVKKQKAVA